MREEFLTPFCQLWILLFNSATASDACVLCLDDSKLFRYLINCQDCSSLKCALHVLYLEHAGLWSIESLILSSVCICAIL